ncbi:MAG: hypothetical protein ACREBH_02405 [Candidatus Micrarchaeaceae archaeon]
MPTTSGHVPKRHGLISTKIIIAIAIAAIIGVSLVVVSLYITVTSALNSIPHVGTGPLPAPKIGASLAMQDMLSYNSVVNALTGATVPLYYMPYVLVDYSVHNVSVINANVSLYKYAPPPTTMIYIFNTSNQCWQCGDTGAIISAMEQKLEDYGIIQGPQNITIVSASDLTSLPNDSILIIMNGLLPSQFLAPIGDTTKLQYLLERHVSILYIGQNFQSVIDQSGAKRPTLNVLQNQTFPIYLDTSQFTGNSVTKQGFYFNSSTFVFTNGTTYSKYLTYENEFNGSIAAFSNFTSSWKNANESGYDIAKAVREMFWLPIYASGTRTVNTMALNSSGQLGVLLNSLPLQQYNTSLPSEIDLNGSLRIELAANGTYSYRTSNDVYYYMHERPELYYNGTLGMSTPIITNRTVQLSFTLLTNSKAPLQLTPHVTIYTINNSENFGPGVALQLSNVTNGSTFELPQRFILPPGLGYIIRLYNFQGQEYAAAFFNVSPITFTLIRSNITADQFTFSAISDGQPVKGLPYTVELNGAYPSNGSITNGTIYYAVPTGTPTIRGNLNFTIAVSGTNFHYYTSYNPLPFSVNSQYIEIVVVFVIMLVMIMFVKAPSRDEFYIDVPNLPEEKKVPIRIKASEIVNVFDKLNVSYHWKYMPLSKSEIRYAISSNIRYNNVPVGLTYSNVERILDQLTVKKYLISTDDLYAPAQWVPESKHDIEYLSTFKKLRLYLVTHGYIFTEIDMSTSSDIVATLHNERKYIVIYSQTSRFQKVPIYTGSKTYIAFLNSYKLEEFKNSLYESNSEEAEELKMYMAADYVKLVDAGSPEGSLN